MSTAILILVSAVVFFAIFGISLAISAHCDNDLLCLIAYLFCGLGLAALPAAYTEFCFNAWWIGAGIVAVALLGFGAWIHFVEGPRERAAERRHREL